MDRPTPEDSRGGRSEETPGPGFTTLDGRAGRAGRGRAWTVRALQLGLTLLVTWIIFRAVGVRLEDLEGLDPAAWRPRGGFLAGASLLLLAGYGMSAALWGHMVRDLGGPRLPVGTAVRTFFIANLGRYLPGKLWQIAGLAWLARKKGVSPSVATGAAVMGQAFALAGAAVVGSTAFLGAGGELRTTGVIVLGAVLIGLVVAAVPRLLRGLLGLWFRLLRREVPDGLVVGPGFAPRWVALYTLNWSLYAIAFWLLVLAFERPGTLLQTAPAFAAAYLVGYLAVFSPAGLGIREGVLTAFLAPVTGQGAAAALAVLARLWTTAVEVVPAGALWLRHLQLEGRTREGKGEA